MLSTCLSPTDAARLFRDAGFGTVWDVSGDKRGYLSRAGSTGSGVTPARDNDEAYAEQIEAAAGADATVATSEMGPQVYRRNILLPKPSKQPQAIKQASATTNYKDGGK